jgi:alpha-ketoglutarate-dependent taurine dioxygenase
MAGLEGSIPLSSLGDIEIRRMDEHPSSLVELRAPTTRFAWPDFTRGEGDSIRRLLHSEGALVFRGFGLDSPTACGRFAASLTGELLEYSERSSPRHSVHGRVYTSTDHPAREEIFLHNENSYRTNWSLTLYFFCLQPADEGGDTPVADTRAILRDLDPGVRATFEQRGWMLQRNLREHVGLSWQTAFNTTDPEVVERYCDENGIACEWQADGLLRTRAVRKAVHQHPRTGELVWFNHATFFHVSTLAAATREALLTVYDESELPTNTYYGDGSPIEPEVLDHLRARHRARQTPTRLRRGDVLAIDNMLYAHGRTPYAGERQVLVAMAEPYHDGQDVER